MMRAAVLRGPRRLSVERVPRPEPAPGEVLVRLTGCGICGSELPAYQGRDWFDYPFPPGAPGHEGWGYVEALGDSVDGLTQGQKVAAISHNAHAEYEVVPADAIVPIPAAIGEQPFPGEALGCAFNVFTRSRVGEGDTVAVVGVGFLGALLIQLCSTAGAQVIAVSRRDHSLEAARLMGASEVVRLDEDVVARIGTSTGGGLCDVVIECTGLQEPLDIAAELVRGRGVLVIAGYHQDGLRTVNMQSWNWRGIDVVNAHEREVAAYVRGVEEAARRIAEGTLDPSPLYTHLFPLDQAEDAFATAALRPDGFMKAVLLT